jgi:hypothetical protein
MFRVTEAIPEVDFSLQLRFSNGELRRFDIRPYLDKGVFVRLQDYDQFCQVKVVGGTVEWFGEIDLCPDTLFEKSEPIVDQGAFPTGCKQRIPGSGKAAVLSIAPDFDDNTSCYPPRY